MCPNKDRGQASSALRVNWDSFTGLCRVFMLHMESVRPVLLQVSADEQEVLNQLEISFYFVIKGPKFMFDQL